MNSGYIKLHREIQDHWVWKNGPASWAQAWIELIFLAAWKPHTIVIGGHPVDVDRGDLVASIRFLAKRWQWGHKKTMAFLQLLQTDGMLLKKQNGSGNGSPSLFSIANYDTYQAEERAEGHGSGNAWGTVEERLENETKKGKNGKKETTAIPAPNAPGTSAAATEPAWGAPEALVALYNQSVPPGHPHVTRLTDGRRAKAVAYLKQFPDRTFWVQAFGQIRPSAFLRGHKASQGHQHFRANFDWLLSKGKDGTENIIKVAEGRYRDEDQEDDDDAS